MVTFERPLFDPVATPAERVDGTENVDAYEFHDRTIVNAVNVAMAARRPLLVTGPPGSGKSGLALAVARHLGWTYVEQVFTSRTELSDLTSGYDSVRRLADAQLQRLLPDWAYLQPGVLWWAFAPESAASRGQGSASADVLDVVDPRRHAAGSPLSGGTVVLLDEIDKAEPDVPNDLLKPLDLGSFHVRGIGEIKRTHDIFVLITSNGERRLPPAFLRRCAHLHLAPGNREFFAAVAEAHFGTRDDDLYLAVADDLEQFRQVARRESRREPSTAEYLDTIRACGTLGVRPGHPGWQAVLEAALWKEPRAVEADYEPAG
jgi:MoxR-like ATPase